MKTTNAAKNVSPISISPKGDKAIANDAGKPQRIAVLQALNTADDLMGGALVAALSMTAEFGPTSKDEVSANYTRCNNPDVYASTFNRGAKVAGVIGVKATLELIGKASGDGTGGAGYRKACDALSSILSQAKDAGAMKTGLAPKAAKAAATFAIKAASEKSVTRKVATKPGPVIRTKSAVALASLAVDAGRSHADMAAFVLLASQTATRLPEREGKESLHREACAALAEACEMWQRLAK